jgi:hypothetical protein
MIARVLFLAFLALAVAGVVQLAKADTLEALGARLAAHASLAGHPHGMQRVEALGRHQVAVDGDIKRLQKDVAKVLSLLEGMAQQRDAEMKDVKKSVSTLETWRSGLAVGLGLLGSLLMGLLVRGKIRISWGDPPAVAQIPPVRAAQLSHPPSASESALQDSPKTG